MMTEDNESDDDGDVLDIDIQPEIEDDLLEDKKPASPESRGEREATPSPVPQNVPAAGRGSVINPLRQRVWKTNFGQGSHGTGRGWVHRPLLHKANTGIKLNSPRPILSMKVAPPVRRSPWLPGCHPSSLPTQHQTLLPMLQQNMLPMLQQGLLSLPKQSLRPMLQQSLRPILQQSLRPMLQQSLRPMLQQSLRPTPQQDLLPTPQQDLQPLPQLGLYPCTDLPAVKRSVFDRNPLLRSHLNRVTPALAPALSHVAGINNDNHAQSPVGQMMDMVQMSEEDEMEKREFLWASECNVSQNTWPDVLAPRLPNSLQVSQDVQTRQGNLLHLEPRSHQESQENWRLQERLNLTTLNPPRLELRRPDPEEVKKQQMLKKALAMVAPMQRGAMHLAPMRQAAQAAAPRFLEVGSSAGRPERWSTPPPSYAAPSLTSHQAAFDDRNLEISWETTAPPHLRTSSAVMGTTRLSGNIPMAARLGPRPAASSNRAATPQADHYNALEQRSISRRSPATDDTPGNVPTCANTLDTHPVKTNMLGQHVPPAAKAASHVAVGKTSDNDPQKAASSGQLDTIEQSSSQQCSGGINALLAAALEVMEANGENIDSVVALFKKNELSRQQANSSDRCTGGLDNSERQLIDSQQIKLEPTKTQLQNSKPSQLQNSDSKLSQEEITNLGQHSDAELQQKDSELPENLTTSLQQTDSNLNNNLDSQLQQSDSKISEVELSNCHKQSDGKIEQTDSKLSEVEEPKVINQSDSELQPPDVTPPECQSAGLKTIEMEIPKIPHSDCEHSKCQHFDCQPLDLRRSESRHSEVESSNCRDSDCQSSDCKRSELTHRTSVRSMSPYSSCKHSNCSCSDCRRSDSAFRHSSPHSDCQLSAGKRSYSPCSQAVSDVCSCTKCLDKYRSKKRRMEELQIEKDWMLKIVEWKRRENSRLQKKLNWERYCSEQNRYVSYLASTSSEKLGFKSKLEELPYVPDFTESRRYSHDQSRSEPHRHESYHHRPHHHRTHESHRHDSNRYESHHHERSSSEDRFPGRKRTELPRHSEPEHFEDRFPEQRRTELPHHFDPESFERLPTEEAAIIADSERKLRDHLRAIQQRKDALRGRNTTAACSHASTSSVNLRRRNVIHAPGTTVNLTPESTASSAGRSSQPDSCQVVKVENGEDTYENLLERQRLLELEVGRIAVALQQKKDADAGNLK